MKTADDRPLGPELKDRLRREFDRLQLVVEHIRELERIQGDRLKHQQEEGSGTTSARKRIVIRSLFVSVNLFMESNSYGLDFITGNIRLARH